MAAKPKSEGVVKAKAAAVQKPRLRTVSSKPFLASDLEESSCIPAQIERFPELRYMGSKKRLLPWIHRD